MNNSVFVTKSLWQSKASSTDNFKSSKLPHPVRFCVSCCHLSVNFLSDVIPFYNFHISYLHITNSSSCSTSAFQNHANPIYETVNEP